MTFRKALGNIIFEADTPAGKAFDIVLLIAIGLSILTVMISSVDFYQLRYITLLGTLEWAFTILFTVEYGLRIYSAHNRRKYILSFYGLVDLIAILPSYIGVLFGGAQYFLVIRSLRLLRIFRVLKLVHFIGEADILMQALRASRAKIIVFLLTVISLVLIIGSAMHLIEGPASGFDNIPLSVYWAIVTLTTVGFGDITPQTTLGRLLSSVVMILGYGIIAVPTGIVTSELARASHTSPRHCPNCQQQGHTPDASFCKYCGTKL
jgi:voltage-gated potassium channel